GLREVTAARLEPGDVPEDEAARRIALAAAGPGLRVAEAFTGRCNLYAEQAGLARIDRASVDAVNAIDESLTIATLAESEPVAPRQMLATVKIIPFAAPEAAVARAEALLRAGPPAVALAPFRPHRAGLIQTRLDGTKPTVLDKTVAVTRARLEARGSVLARELRCEHTIEALAQAIRTLAADGLAPILIVSASATTDRRDVLPAGVVAAGGAVEHFGMPVDPGNLIVVGQVGAVPAIGLPGCARSPKRNGFDFVLDRLLAGIEVGRGGIVAMGVGGLLTEIATRPQPREAAADAETQAPHAPRIAAIVLAAGRSTRMGQRNKLLEEIDGRPLVARVVDRVLQSQARPVVVVTGHQGERVRAALAGREVTLVDNPDFAAGLSTSLRRGLAALPAEIDGAAICLGDMPETSGGEIDRLIAAFAPGDGRAICVPTHDSRRGNPVLWSRRFFAAMSALGGDVGAKALLDDYADQVCEVAMGGAGVLVDLDTPEALAAFRSRSRA
ncbi:MAG: 4-diphosphocytidyl-2C-methyl-D-erythritol kinase, partial [Alphaproteobacteria bacterium]|nr:4-diphosphocytidyl-2C-methyl-D-erythritol kinase [Alphaproteobacteria bacterium]